jgi:hypothetical protein
MKKVDVRLGWGVWVADIAAIVWLWFARCAFLGTTRFSLAGALWFVLAAGLLVAICHLCHRAAQNAWPSHPLEILRWVLLGAGTVWLMSPLYSDGSLGSGDSYWYTVMMADFVAQLRHGIFPIWVGQSEFAFNGAVSPLRVAPWLQHMGGLLDLMTGQSLEPAALKNAVLCANGFAIVGSAYLCLRQLLPNRPELACALALLWLASPGVLAPLYFGDEYMEFMAMPFLPPLLLGCWRLWSRDDGTGRLPLVVGLSGLWLSHTPMGLWGSLLAATMYVARILCGRIWPREGRRFLWMALLFILLGAFPIGSALVIDNATSLSAVGGQVPDEIAKAFPGNFLPIDPHFPGPAGFQIGYSLLTAAAIALFLIVWLRPRGGTAFAIALFAVAPLTLPVPWLSDFIWLHTPNLIVSINNIWPMQRLFAIWTILIAFAFAIGAGVSRVSGNRSAAIALLIILVCGGIWSASEATKFMQGIRYTFVSGPKAEVFLRPENMRLTRYGYSSFAKVPSYFSHGYIDPLLENRLLDRRTQAILASDADAAAPSLNRPGSGENASKRLVQSGTWTAISFNRNRIYVLTPQIHLESGRNYAMRFDFIHPDKVGVLQIYSDDLFREYMLPDSGGGMTADGPPLAFGSLPTSGHVVPLRYNGPEHVDPIIQFVMRQYGDERFDLARFWLYTYEPSDLPVRVTSLTPYKAEVTTAVPAFLETPRIWQRGWTAQVNGRIVPVQDSLQHLVMVPVEPGRSHVVLVFRPPLWLSAWFWLGFLGWVALAIRGAGRLVRLAFTPNPGLEH